MSYGPMLAALGGGGGAAPNPAALGIGLGKPPDMPGVPPPPTNVGAMPTGAPSTDKKVVADQAVQSLRDLKGAYPQLGTMLDAAVDAIKAAATTPAAGPAPATPGQPAAPGTPPPVVPPPATSGAPGAL